MTSFPPAVRRPFGAITASIQGRFAPPLFHRPRRPLPKHRPLPNDYVLASRWPARTDSRRYKPTPDAESWPAWTDEICASLPVQEGGENAH